MISVTLNHDQCHLEPIFNEEGELLRANNLVDSWLIEQGIAFTKDPITAPHPIYGINKVDWMEATVGHNYLFENGKDAMMFKLRWR